MLSPAPDEVELAQLCRSFLADRAPMAAVRAVAESSEPYDAELWRGLATEVGVVGLGFAAEHGGAGCGIRHVTAVAHELGRGLVPSPYLGSSVLFAGLLEASGDTAAQARWLPDLAAGRAVGAAAVPATVSGVRASGDPDRLQLSGTVDRVLGAPGCEVVIVVARLGEREVLALVRGDDPGVRWMSMAGMDLTRTVSSLTLTAARGRLIATDAAGLTALVLDRARLALAAEQCGAMSAVVEASATYARERHAFGLPIGAFQAIKHSVADAYTAWELATAALRGGLEAVETSPGSPHARLGVLTARLVVTRAYRAAALANIRIHGGLGVTWDFDAHLFHRHALVSASLLGTEAADLNELAALVLDSGPLAPGMDRPDRGVVALEGGVPCGSP